MPATYEAAVAGWADHLRSGGTTTWPAWRDGTDHPTLDPPLDPARPLPDAVHLELVRRLNLAAGAPVPGLAQRVLSTASPGRGLVDVPLSWPAAPRSYGSPATDPDALPEDELIRLATGVIVHLLPALPRARTTPEPSPWPLPWRRRFRLHGSPATAATVRRGLLARGLVESDWRPTHVVLARPIEAMMAEEWATRTRAGGILKWTTLWRRAEVHGRLPHQIDVPAIAGSLRGRPREPVYVVVARDAQEAMESTALLLGVRPGVVRPGGDPAEADLLRRVNRLTALAHGPERVRDLAARLAHVLDEGLATAGEAPAPTVPPASRDWATEQAAAVALALRRDGYAVHGNPDDLAPADTPGPHFGTVDRHRTLELAVAACLRIWRLQEGTS
jgi:hypothetical protein